ncbi:homeobox-1 [Abeliophyllum distichum]|uniref:Homeobox-1 n=1 Tax=Abeliophyllum distichum TaxID=126358 RepID=A0ABD1UHK0_9LAMI
MEAGSEGGINRNVNKSQSEGPKRPKRQMKTPFQLETLEKIYAMEMYPSEATRAELSEKLGLSDRQLQMWFCHRRLKDKKEAAGVAAMKPCTPISVGRRGLMESPRDELTVAEPGSEHGSGSGSDSDSSESDNGDDMPTMPIRYYESHRSIMERRVIACVEAQLGEPLREDGPILGVEFDVLPPGAFGSPIVPAEHWDRYRHSYDGNFFDPYDVKQNKDVTSGLHEPPEPKIRSDAYGHVAMSYLYNSPVDGPTAKSPSLMHGNGRLHKEYVVEGRVSSADLSSQSGRQRQPSSPPRNGEYIPYDEDISQMERKRKIDEARSGREVQVHEKKIRKELEKHDLLRQKREEQIKKEMEKQDRERRKEEQKMTREQQRQEERFQREERREMERREKFMQKELLQAERRKQKEERQREKEAARQKAAVERAMARRIAKESMELIEDERLELMELSASSKGLPSILSLDYDTLQNLESFRDALRKFPPKSVRLEKPFAIQPWIDSEENVGNLLMVWRFCFTFADVLGLWPFTLDEFVQAFHDYDSRLLGEIHIALLKLIVKDIEDVARTPSGGPGTNQYTSVNLEGGHPQIVEGAYLWGFDICNWKKHLNPLTWPEILRQFALSAGFGPHLMKKSVERARNKGCEDAVSTLRNGSAAENAVAIMQEKGTLQRRTRHRLTPGTVKFAAYHVLALEGSKGLNVIELADKIQKSGLRDLTTSKTPEASISVALSRDPILFERIAPSTYCVRPAFRKDPVDAESILATAREKIQKYANGFLAGQNADDEERDDDSDCDMAEGSEVVGLATPSDAKKTRESSNEVDASVNGKDYLPDETALHNDNGIGVVYRDQEGVEIDESRSGEPWVQGLTEGEYSDLSVEERLNALVALIGVANEGNSIRVILEDRLDAANALKKQMWAEAQLDKRRMREEIITKFNDSSINGAAECVQSPLSVTENKMYDASVTTMGKDEPSRAADDVHNSTDNPAQGTSMSQLPYPIQQNGYMTERSRLQLKSYIGHRAEEEYVYRSLPLGQDRRHNRYWQFVASSSSQDPGSGRIFVESPDGNWMLIDSEEAFDALLTSLDMRGTRESHLHIMLRKTEVSFRARVHILDQSGNRHRNEVAEVNSIHSWGTGADSPANAICGTNADTREPSLSFKIDLGRSETEKKNALKRYEDLQIWMWNECFNSSILRALAYGKKRCSPLLGICDLCFGTYQFKEDLCPFCQKNFGEASINGEEKIKLGTFSLMFTKSSLPLRIRLIKALLSFFEVSVPSEALQSSWTENCRNTWGLKLLNSSSTEDLLQILTQIEIAIKRNYLSADFETTEELMGYCASSRGASYEFSYPGSFPQLPWIPQTTAAVALKLLELDASLSYVEQQMAESHDVDKVEPLPKLKLKYAYTKDIQKAETSEFDKHGPTKVENWAHLRHTHGSSGYRQMARRQGSGRPHGKSRKRIAGSKLESGVPELLGGGGEQRKRNPKGHSQITWVTGVTLKNVVEKPVATLNTANIEGEKDGSSNSSMEGGDFDEDANSSPCEFEKWGASYGVVPDRDRKMVEMSDEDANEIDQNNVYDEEGGENMEEDMVTNAYYSDRNRDGDKDDGSDSLISGDYSD